MGVPKPLVWWGMECPDWLYTRAALRGGESYRAVCLLCRRLRRDRVNP